MTITELAKLNKTNGGFFFSPETLDFWGDSIDSFYIVEEGDKTITLKRLNGVGTGWTFDKRTGRVIRGLLPD